MGDGITQPTKPSIVFVHGIWADGSSFRKVIPTLQAEGHEVVAAQNSLDSLQDHGESSLDLREPGSVEGRRGSGREGRGSHDRRCLLRRIRAGIIEMFGAAF